MRSYCKTTGGRTGPIRDCPAAWRSKIAPIFIRELSWRQRLPRRTARRSSFSWSSSSELAAGRVKRATRAARPVHRAVSPRALRLRSQVTSCDLRHELLTFCVLVCTCLVLCWPLGASVGTANERYRRAPERSTRVSMCVKHGSVALSSAGGRSRATSENAVAFWLQKRFRG